jgi:carbonic anhydrase/acetyltransferase-like protein (isoleucine patch superfamily)
MSIYQLGDDAPQIDPSAFIADNATVIGKVVVSAGASVWFNVTIRGDNETITIGPNSNVQESCVLHTDMGYPLTLAANVTVGHQAMLHGCTIGEGSLVGIQAVVLNNAKIGKKCVIGAGALVTEGKEFPDNSLIVGSPAKLMRTLSDEEVQRFLAASAIYVERAQVFKKHLKRIG